MKYRLLVDREAIRILDGLPRHVRTRLLNHLDELRAFPEKYSDGYEHDEVGRRVEISVHAGCCIHYWIDPADRHIKILALTAADH